MSSPYFEDAPAARAQQANEEAGEDPFLRDRADSLGSQWTRNSFGTPMRKSGKMLRDIMQAEGSEGHSGGIDYHRQPRVRAHQTDDFAGSWRQGLPSASSTTSAEAGAVGGAPQQRRGFFNGSFNPFKWNWGRLFGRGR